MRRHVGHFLFCERHRHSMMVSSATDAHAPYSPSTQRVPGWVVYCSTVIGVVPAIAFQVVGTDEHGTVLDGHARHCSVLREERRAPWPASRRQKIGCRNGLVEPECPTSSTFCAMASSSVLGTVSGST